MNKLPAAVDEAVRNECIATLSLHGYCASVGCGRIDENVGLRLAQFVAQSLSYEEVPWSAIPTEELMGACAYIMRTAQEGAT